ncbi:hypothetical protein GN956_G20307 [Arapaima gigas]
MLTVLKSLTPDSPGPQLVPGRRADDALEPKLPRALLPQDETRAGISTTRVHTDLFPGKPDKICGLQSGLVTCNRARIRWCRGWSWTGLNPTSTWRDLQPGRKMAERDDSRENDLDRDYEERTEGCRRRDRLRENCVRLEGE